MRLLSLTFAGLALATSTHDPNHGDGHHRLVGHGQIRFDGAGPERWAQRFHREQREVTGLRRQLRRQRRALLATPTVTEAINLAAATYGNGATLWRKARCESGLNPSAHNGWSTASGLFQFLDSTWASTPYAGFSILSPYANALAAGWMHAHGRGGEWVCQ